MEDVGLRALNSDPNLDFITSNFNALSTDDFINPYSDSNISSHFYDNVTFINKFKNTPFPLILNLNVQSLVSKYTKLREFVSNLLNNHINIKIICLQETWNVPFPDLVTIPGFSFIHKQRNNNRGGGLDFM
jgi:hypothetical protein